MTNAIAIVGAIVAAIAWRVSMRGDSYATRFYGMTPPEHRRIAALFASAALLLVVAARLPWWPSVPADACVLVGIVLYVSSFARGAVGEEEL